MRRGFAGSVAAVAVVFALSPAAGCSSVDRALDCAHTALTVTGAVNDLQQAVSGAPNDPQQAEQALDRIESDLNALQGSTGDTDLRAAVADLDEAVSDARAALDQGRTPDVGPVGDAADELSTVCSPA